MDDESGYFEISELPDKWELEPQRSTEVEVSFVPMTDGGFTTALQVVSNDPDGDQLADVVGFGEEQGRCENLELSFLVEYEIAARLAWFAGHGEWTDELLALGEVEWDHELCLRTEATRHWAWRWFPTWKAPAPRNSIRERFASFLKNPTPVRRRTNLLLP